MEVHAVSDLREALPEVTVTARARWEYEPADSSTWSEETTWAGDLDADDCARIGRFRFAAPEGHGPLVVDLELVSDRLLVTNRYRTVVIPSSEGTTPVGNRSTGPGTDAA